MSKYLLSFVCLSVFALAHPFDRAAAAPGSTEEADRQFLANLEKADAAAASSRSDTSTPATKVAKPRLAPQEPPVKAAAAIQKSPDSARPAKRERTTKPDEVAASDPPQVVSAPRVIVVPDPDTDREHDYDRDGHHHFFHRLFSHLLSKHPEDW